MRRKLPVHIAKEVGRKNYTKEELREREEKELDIRTDDIQPSDDLPENLHDRFFWYVDELNEFGLLSNADSDALSRYVMTEHQYWKVTKAIDKMAALNPKYNSLLNAQKKLFDSARLLGNDLGLSLASRMNLEKKPKEETKEKTDAEKLFGNIVSF